MKTDTTFREGTKNSIFFCRYVDGEANKKKEKKIYKNHENFAITINKKAK
jgi:hypothetical protein